ncbi:phosphatidylethanolamine/phosphatidyl-N-methylethanolamine N-methyltransferase [Cyclonatronum proteinivorum]|uniref:Phosphatidylethanolamine/phosphatidyl-N-methylethanolamine N-methyltransferase n=2 Tax=Cyclonatronum proteinivorum TaxID=1457365 RepID=A0A345UGN5_9BACT|nr:phosphatidylethanolamine/phosphatidyl-N-methylethanolamine N-methyltransferase [Cyclonatronum proteinivorum]
MVRFLSEKVQQSSRPLRILELGPGTGTLTKAILRVIRPQDSLDLVEINPHFCRMLRREFRHPNMQVHYADLLEFNPEEKFDYIFSSIPYESIPEEVSKGMWEQKLKLCKPGGLISYYKYVNFNHFRCKFEKELVETCSIDRSFVIRNFPPAQLFTLRIGKEPEAAPAPVKLARKKNSKPRFMLTA